MTGQRSPAASGGVASRSFGLRYCKPATGTFPHGVVRHDIPVGAAAVVANSLLPYSKNSAYVMHRWEKPERSGAEGATAPETLRQKDQRNRTDSGEWRR